MCWVEVLLYRKVTKKRPLFRRKAAVFIGCNRKELHQAFDALEVGFVLQVVVEVAQDGQSVVGSFSVDAVGLFEVLYGLTEEGDDLERVLALSLIL
jgi:hypothetical protein